MHKPDPIYLVQNQRVMCQDNEGFGLQPINQLKKGCGYTGRPSQRQRDRTKRALASGWIKYSTCFLYQNKSLAERFDISRIVSWGWWVPKLTQACQLRAYFRIGFPHYCGIHCMCFQQRSQRAICNPIPSCIEQSVHSTQKASPRRTEFLLSRW